MKPSGSLRECAASIFSTKVQTILVVLIALGINSLSMATAGRNMAVKEGLESDLGGIGARTVVIQDGGGSAISNQVVDVLSSLSLSQAAIALTNPIDVFAGQLGSGAERVPLVQISGDTEAAFELTEGRLPGEGEVIAGSNALAILGLSHGVGFVQDTYGQQWSVVGVSEAKEPFSRLTNYLIGSDDSGEVGQFSMVAPNLASVCQMEKAFIAVIGVEAGSDLVVESACGRAEESIELIRTLSASGQAQLLMIEGVGAVFMAIVALTDVLLHARDLGRRRTLGISRSGLVSFVATKTTVITFVGSSLGAGSTWAVLAFNGTVVPVRFALATVVITTFVAAWASLGPALLAAFRDPVRVMRTP